MKPSLYVSVVIAGILMFAVGRITARGAASLNQKTQENLSTAMHGEAFAHAKYLFYAQQARANGNAAVAELFTKAADTERLEHFAEEARLAGLAKDDTENLKDAIKGESYEVDTMYREFAEQAKAAGDEAAAKRFEEIRHDEMGHRDAFKAALASLETTNSR